MFSGYMLRGGSWLWSRFRLPTLGRNTYLFNGCRRAGVRNFWRPLIIRALPGGIRVIALHILDDFQRVRAKVFLVNDPIVAHHESAHSGDAVFGWNGNKSEPANHDSFDHIVELSQWSRRPLSLQNLEIVAVISRAFAGGVTLCNCAGHRLADRASWVPSSFCQYRPSCFPGVLKIFCAYWLTPELS